MLVARGLPGRSPVCDRKAIDLATHGTFSSAPAPAEVRHGPVFAATKIDGIAVAGGHVPDWRDETDPATALELYLPSRMILAPRGFVEQAADCYVNARAMTR